MENEVKNYLKDYCDFVTKVTSEPSLDQKALIKRMEEIEAESNIKSARLLTAALGLGSEGGEFVEIVKKIFLQGKPFTEDNVFHMKRELGDIIWYWATACMALDLDPYEVINENKSKLEARYGKGLKLKKVNTEKMEIFDRR